MGLSLVIWFACGLLSTLGKLSHVRLSWPRGYQTFLMLNTVELGIYYSLVLVPGIAFICQEVT